jgi:hypothetical protein
MPTFKENLTRFRERARAAWAKTDGKRPSRKTLLITLGSVVGVILGLIIVLGILDWNMLRGPIERMASNRLGRTVNIDGNIDVEILRWSPEADVRGIRISNPKWAGGGDMTRIDRLQVKVKLLPLLKGDVVMPLLKIDKPAVRLVQDADGRNNWTFKKRSKEPMQLPPIRRFEINDGQLSIDDAKRKLVFRGRVTSSEEQGGRTVQAFKLLGDGTLNGAKFDLDLSGGPLLNVDPDKPYPFDAKLSAGATRVLAKGTIAEPFNLGVFDTSLSVSGNDLADLYYLTGLAFPNTPPYRISGEFDRRNLVYDYKDFTGRVGDSDLSGQLSVETGDDKPFLSADIRSKRLDFDDLAAVLGAGTKPSETASPEQAATARQLAASQRLFPDTPLRVERLRVMDAAVRYRADSVVDAKFPVRKASMNLKLNNAVLTLDPVTFGLDRGQVAGLVAINAQKDMPVVNMDVRMTGANIQEFVPVNFKPLVNGGMIGRARLTGAGLSVRDVAANADGQVTLVIPSGEMRKGIAELMGVNVLKYLFTEKSDRTPVRCALADFKVTDGVMRAQTIVFDTGPVIVTGGGVIDLRSERMDLKVKGHPKEVRLLRLNLPLELQGTLRRPAFGVEAGNAVGQGAIAAALGAALSPIAAILPFVDLGEHDDANCGALIGGAGTPARKGQQAARPPKGKSG